MRVSKFTLFVFMVFGFYAAKAQLPIAYYDFEDNSARNTTIETTLETAVSTIGTPTVTDANGLTSSNGVGNGAGYGGSNTGYALGYYGFTTGAGAPTAAASDALPHIIFGPFTTTGLATLTLTMDLMGIGDKRPGNAVIYWSTDNVTYTRVATYPTVGTSFATESFTLPAGASNQASLYIRVLGYNPSNTGTPDGTNGVMKIDNFTLRSSQINTTLTLANASTHGTGLTSGDTYLPIYSSFYLNSGTGNDVTMSSSLSLSGYVDLTSGNLVVGANTLSFQVQTGNGSTTGPIRKSGADAGFIVFGTSSNMVIGDGTETATTTIPNNSFSAPSGMGNLTINRNTATVNWGNNPIQITGDLTVTSGVFIKNVAAGTIDVDGDVVLSNIGDFRITSVGLNVDGDMNISDDAFFRISATNANVTIAGSLSINDNGQVILSGNNTGSYVSVTVSTNLNIGSAATLDLANNNAIIVVDGNVTGSGTISSAASNRRIVVTGATSTLSKDIFYGNLEINTGGTVSLLGNTFVTGFIRLTAGSLAVGAGNTLSLTAPTIVPIQRNGGSQLGLLTMSATSVLEFGDGTQTATITLPNSFFTTPTTFATLTVNRTSGTLNWGNNPITLTSNANIDAGTGYFIINNSLGIIGVGGNLNVNSGEFRIGVAANIPVTGNLNLVGDLRLTNAASNLVVTGNVTGSGTHTAASLGQLELVGIGSTISNTITYDNVNINTGGTINLTGSTTIGGTLRLTAGVLNVGAANTLTLTLNGSPVLRNGGSETGTITMAATSVFTCGDGSQTATTTLANSIFTSPTSFATLNINRASGTTNWGNNPITLTGNAEITAGSGIFAINNASGELNVGGNLNINSGEFRVSVAANNTVTGNLYIVGTLGLTTPTAYVTVSGNVTGSGSQTAASTGRIIMVGTGANTLASTVTYDNVEINTATGISLTGSTTFGGNLRLTLGNLNVGSNTITFHTDNTPLIRTSGNLNLASGSSIRFGNAGNMGGNNFTIPDDVFTGSNIEFANFYMNRTNRITLNNQNIAITGFLSVEAGMLALPAGYVFTLRSTSISNTAMVTEVGAAGVIAYGTAAVFRVERYVPQTGGTGVRAYRDFAPSVNTGTGTIFDNWQEGGTNGLDGGVYYGTHITGIVGSTSGYDAATGFDKTYSSLGSLSTFDVSTITGAGTWTTWSNATSRSTNQANDTISAFKGYRVLIRGNRLVDLFTGPTPTTMNAPAILRSRGKLVYGDVVFNTTGVTANGATNSGIRLNSASATGYTMVGNPYACPVDWELVHADAGTTNLSSTIYVFDPNLSSSGAYATYNATTHTTAPVASAANKYIQPGQAIFVKNTSVAPTLTFRETHKAPNSANLTNVFKASSDSASFSKIYINLNKQLNNLSYKIADGVAIVFDNSFNDGDGPEDASKISNNLENLSIIAKNAKQWIIEGRKQAYINDTVQLRMYYGANAPVGGNYQLEINMDEFINNGLQAYLYDKYTNTLTSLGMTGVSTYNYNVTSTAATYNYRFSIVFKSGSVLPVSFITLNAAIQNKDVSVNWTVAESNIASYQIQRSSNAVEFTTVGTVVANGNAISSTQKYNWIDAEPLNGNNYYRIIANGKDGKTTNSSIVLVRLSDNSSITVYPNPVKDRRMNLLTESLAKGDYEIQVYNLEGKNIYSSIIKHNGGTASYVINLPLAVTSGMYQMIIKGKEYTNTQNIVVE